MKLNTKLFTMTAFAAIAAPMALIGVSHGSDHADTPEIAAKPGGDLTDVFAFPSTTNSNNVVLAMDVHPLIPTGSGPTTYFDPNVLYQFKLDNTGDGVEDLVIQVRFFGTGANQTYTITGPVAPSTLGTSDQIVQTPQHFTGTINQVVAGGGNVAQVFCGAREDPFFFDLEQFFNILPDRATPLNGVPIHMPNAPQATSFRPKGSAVDFLAGYNVLSIVVEVPKTAIAGKSGTVGLWTTTGVANGAYYDQLDRLARPAVNEVFATVAGGRHKINDEDTPRQDHEELENDIMGFMHYPAGRSSAITQVVKDVLVPDMMMFNVNGTGAAYLGVETGGATGGTFGGRALTDDVVDISLGVIFGNTIPALGLAPDDGKEIPGLTTDNVDDSAKHFITTFPYLGNPQ